MKRKVSKEVPQEEGDHGMLVEENKGLAGTVTENLFYSTIRR